MFNKYSSAQLVDMLQGSRQQSNEAIAIILRKNEERVIRYVRSRGGSQEDGEDVLQEGLADLVISVRRGAFQMKSSIHTFLMSICKNKWSDRYKKQKRERDYQLAEAGKARPAGKESAAAFEANEELSYWLGQLKQGCRQVLVYWAQGYNMHEIAKMMGYGSRQVAMNKKSACMKALHALLGKKA
ncbi:MAG: sigma-70 family RNA polymerase sigma factor [Bacteroidetes bacterium]|nr:MAG: sigma-70 family RNA polymerase sigma factor [Bacteroidota bacterium]